MSYIDFLSYLHKKTKRDYLARVNEFPKAEAAKAPVLEQRTRCTRARIEEERLSPHLPYEPLGQAKVSSKGVQRGTIGHVCPSRLIIPAFQGTALRHQGQLRKKVCSLHIRGG